MTKTRNGHRSITVVDLIASPEFRLGFIDARTGQPFRYDLPGRQSAYEVGRLFAAGCPGVSLRFHQGRPTRATVDAYKAARRDGTLPSYAREVMLAERAVRAAA